MSNNRIINAQHRSQYPSHRRRVALRIALTGSAVMMLLLLSVADPRLLGLMRNSLLLAIGAAAISLPTGIVLSFLLMRTDLPCRKLFLWLIAGGMFIPLYVHSAAWSAGFGQLGWFPFVGDPARPVLDSWRGAIWIHAVAAIPWVTLIVGIAARNVNRDIEEYALLYNSSLRVLCSVSLRSIAPAVFAALLWVILMTTSEMTVSDIFRIRTFVEEVYLNSQLDQFSLAPILRPWTNEFEPFSVGLGSQLVVAALFALIAFAMMIELSPATVSTGNSFEFSLGRWKIPAVIAVIAVVIALLGVPVTNLLFKAGVQHVPDGESTRISWEIGNVVERMRAVPAKYGDSFQWSALLGLTAAAIVVVVSFPVAWLARNGGMVRSTPAVLLAAFGFAIPGPTIGLLIIALLDQPRFPILIQLYDRSLLAPALAIAIRILPLTILFLWQAFRSVNRAAMEHAEIAGAGPLRRMFEFGVRQNGVAVVAAFLLAMIFAIGDLTASNLVMPPRVDPLPRLIFGFIHSGVDDQVAVLSLCNILLMLPLVAVFLWLATRRRA